MIKLDLQGAELAALDGATECLKRAKAVLLEVSFIDFERGMPQIADVLAYMKQKGFLPYDILALWHRPIDGAVAQGDVLFVPESSPLRRQALLGESTFGLTEETARSTSPV